MLGDNGDFGTEIFSIALCNFEPKLLNTVQINVDQVALGRKGSSTFRIKQALLAGFRAGCFPGLRECAVAHSAAFGCVQQCS